MAGHWEAWPIADARQPRHCPRPQPSGIRCRRLRRTGEVVCHERHDGFTIEVIRPTRRPGVLGPTESQRDLCRIARWCGPHHLIVEQAGDLVCIPGGVRAIQGHDGLLGIHVHLGSCPFPLLILWIPPCGHRRNPTSSPSVTALGDGEPNSWSRSVIAGDTEATVRAAQNYRAEYRGYQPPRRARSADLARSPAWSPSPKVSR
jgi:hypothetical protein